MKSPLVAATVAGVVSGFVGAALAVVALNSNSNTASSAAAASPKAAANANEGQVDAELRKLQAAAAMRADTDAASVAELNRRIDLLEGELAALRDERSRTAVASVSDKAAELVTPDAVAAIQREAIVQVLEDQRKAEADKREAERKERQRKAADDAAARAAKELGLGAGDERRLADFYLAAASKREEMFSPMRDGAGFDRDAMRKGFEDFRVWAETEVKGAFGDGVGAQILEYQRQQRDSFGMGGFEGPGGGGGRTRRGGGGGAAAQTPPGGGQ
ncbi:MAG: hypothetical protein JNN27_00700 [Planctomycetes bacterium]|nr:hypothetical protein [Planctomycetota bacterium]